VSLILANLAVSVQYVLRVFYVLLLMTVVASFFPPRHPGWWAGTARFVERMTEPALQPIRSRLPTWGGMDFSPLVALLGMYLLGSLVVQGLLALSRAV
jgi:YggT family protein